jgi:hypothetical protein
MTVVSRKKFDIKYYFCVNCDSKTTQTRKVKKKNGRIVIEHDWRIVDIDPPMVMCLSCYKKIFRKEHFRRLGKERFRYKGINIQIKETPRIEVCNCCRAVVPFDCKRTMLHHEEYDDNDKRKHTMEVCPSCHNFLSWELGQFDGLRADPNTKCHLCNKIRKDTKNKFWGKINNKHLCPPCRSKYYHSKDKEEFIKLYLS